MGASEASLLLDEYRPALRDEVLEFVRRVGEPGVGARLAQQWDWKYGPARDGGAAPAGALLLRDAGEIVGMYGWRHFRCHIRGATRRVTLSSDVLVHPAFRHRARPGFTDRFLRDHPLIFGWGKRRPPRATSSGSIVAPEIVAWARPLFPIASRLRRAARGFAGIEEVPRFDARIDRLWQRVAPRFGVALVRDHSYLSWRFDHRPDASYIRLVASESDSPRGYAVLRVEQRGPVRIGYLVDFVVDPGDEHRVLDLLLEATLARLRAERAVIAAGVVSINEYASALRRHGFVRMSLRPWGCLVLSATPGDDAAPCFLDPEQWFTTMGDGDLELAR